MIYKKINFKKFQQEREEELERNLSIPRAKNIGYYIKYFFFKLLSINTKLSKRNNLLNSNELIDLIKVNNILLLRYDVIGDYVVSTSIIRYLKEQNPDVNIDIVVTDKNKVLAENDPNINNIYIAPYSKNVNKKYLALKKLRKNDYDLCFSLVTSNNTKAAIVTKLVAPHSIKICMYNTGNHKIYGLFFNRMIKYFTPATTWTQKMLNIGKLCTTSTNYSNLKNTDPYISINAQIAQNINKFIELNQLRYNPNLANVLSKDDSVKLLKKREGREYVIFNIAGSNINKILSKEKIINVITPLAQKFPELLFFITGGPLHIKLVDNAINEINLANVKTINEDLITFIGLLIGAKLLISPDTAPIHIAATAKVPIVVLFAKEGFLYEWYPYKTKFIPLLAVEDENINSISESDIIYSTNIFLNNEQSELVFDEKYFSN